MTQLVHYESARRALDTAVRFDDVMKVKDIADRAALYAKQAGDTELIEKATEIRVRAQRRAGEMLKQAAEQGMRQRGGNPTFQQSHAATVAPKLEEIGITKSESSRYQQLAAMPAEHFETAVATAKATAGEVTTAHMLRQAKSAATPNPAPQRERQRRPERIAEMRALAASGHNAEQIAAAQGVGVDHAMRIMSEAGIKVFNKKGMRQIDPNKIVRESVAALSGIAHGLRLANGIDIDAEEAAELLAELNAAMKSLRMLSVTLKDISNGQ